MRQYCEASITISATPDEVWKVISDVTRVGEWSGECRGCAWLGGAAAPAPGVRFRGRNHRGGFRWSRVNEVVRADAPTLLVWRTVVRFPYPDSIEWQLRITEAEEGSTVNESFRVLHIPKLMEWMVGLALPAHRDRSQDLGDDLNRLKVVVESSSVESGR